MWADDYHLLSAQAGIYLDGKKWLPQRMYITGDNLLSEKYSLGNDLNAAGNRYYNVASTINFQAGVAWAF